MKSKSTKIFKEIKTTKILWNNYQIKLKSLKVVLIVEMTQKKLYSIMENYFFIYSTLLQQYVYLFHQLKIYLVQLEKNIMDKIVLMIQMSLTFLQGYLQILKIYLIIFAFYLQLQ
ncbi:transmembrane protein, putative (macronuclear) [Tetrahymena thermophila SB210]|uniref:Transmembrane protein, putative n=1 Tax=Tetrahymena thermophila (strain SB210) TaxID=312017 RepID=W7X4B2_TETTS|nr:transmembrane protein, putative [Tetrahymena thermophila SB210]EWS72267.1 transmembrane protein, putative [Tetrahymena thermophila SB210]|eukprot:XP_012655207.1 transmembrane protein, putative [Tetrahymena thermophila SB210]